MNVLRLFPQSIVYANQVTPGKPGSLARLEQAELGRITEETLKSHSLILAGYQAAKTQLGTTSAPKQKYLRKHHSLFSVQMESPL